MSLIRRACLVWIVLAIGSQADAADPVVGAPSDTVDARAADLLARCASHRPSDELFPKEAMAAYVARLLTGRDVE